MSIAAVIVIYKPDAALMKLLHSAVTQFDHVIICNNGFGDNHLEFEIRMTFPNVEILEMYGNRGIGYALNRSIERLVELKIGYMITFDQDTEINPGFVESMLETYANEARKGTKIGIIAPVYKDRNSNEHSAKFIFNKYSFSRDYTIRGRSSEVTMVITSGSLTAISLYENVGRYIEDMFIDYIDNEFCLRLHQAGFKVITDDRIIIQHSLGEKNTFNIGKLKFSPTNHSVIRKYYISRNRLYCIRRYGLMLPSFLIFEILAFSNDVIRISIFESDREKKLKAIIRGLKDGLVFKPEIDYR